MKGNELHFLEKSAHNAAFSTVKAHVGSVVDYCVPVNPYFPTSEMINSYAKNIKELLTYYPEDGEGLNEILAQFLNIPTENIVLGNGSTELITAIDHLFIKERFATDVPTFGRWTDQPAESGKKVIPIHRREEDLFNLDISRMIQLVAKEKIRYLAISNPNNPTGCISDPGDFERLLESDLELLIIDESFLEFATMDRRFSALELALTRPNVIVLRSLGKSLGVHGIRLGYAVGEKSLIGKIQRFLPHWNINSLAVALLKDFPRHQSEYEASRSQVIKDRSYLYVQLSALPRIKVFESYANFLFVKLPAEISGKAFRNQLINQYGYFIRECGNKQGSSSQFLRIAVTPKVSTDALVSAMGELLQVFFNTTKWNL